MSYLANVSIQQSVVDGRKRIVVSVAETGATAASEWSTLASAANIVRVNGAKLPNGEFFAMPRAGQFLLAQASLTAGTGTTIKPRWGTASGWSDSTMAAIGGFPTAAGYQNNAVPLVYAFQPGVPAIMYGKSTPNNAATDHTITSTLLIEPWL